MLCYHQIRAPTSADSATDRAYIVRPSVFDAQMRALDDAGYTTITGEALVDHVAKGARLPRKPILLTFDDGTAGQYTRVLPVLRKHGFVATFFPMTVVLGRPGWLTRGQVRALARAGMSIGAHTYDHKAVPDFTGEDWSTQLTEPGRSCNGSPAARSGSSRTRSACTTRRRSSTCGAPATAPRFQLADDARPRTPALEHPPDHRAGAQRPRAPARDPAGLLGRRGGPMGEPGATAPATPRGGGERAHCAGKGKRSSGRCSRRRRPVQAGVLTVRQDLRLLDHERPRTLRWQRGYVR